MASRVRTALAALSTAALVRGRVHRHERSRGRSPDLGARRQRRPAPGRAGLHRRRAVHDELRLHRQRRPTSTSATPRTARAPARPPTPTAATPGSLPLGTKVEFSEGGSLVSSGTSLGTGTLVYSSWLAMQKAGTTDTNACEYNDFALVKVDPAFVDDVNPSVPFWGGPEAIESNGTTAGEQVHSFGNSSLRGGIEALSPKLGSSLGTTGGGWSHSVYTVTPGVPGDSGSAFLDTDGNALGTLSTLAIAPVAGSNGVGDLSRELSFAQANSGISGLQLALGTEPFSPIL